MKQRSPEQLQDEIDTFNKACKVGASVWLEMDDGTKVNTRVRHEATVLGGHTAMGWFEGIAGCYLLARATPINEGPILFKGPLVVKILSDEKTETRRVADPKLWPLIEEIERVNGKLVWQCADFDLKCRYDHEQLYVRETHRFVEREDGLDMIEYKADGLRRAIPNTKDAGDYVVGRFNKWRPSIHITRWASRIDLKVEEIKLERVQDITEEGAKAEGVEPIPVECVCGATGRHLGDRPSYRYGFEKIWDEINQSRGFGWESNPPVWVVRFERIERALA